MSKENDWPMRLQPLSAEDHEQLQSADGLRRIMRKYSRANSIAGAVRRVAEEQGLSSEHEAWLLAYHALRALQEATQQEIERANTEISPSVFVRRGSSGGGS